MTAFCEAVLSAYIREDLRELDNPMRQDKGILMQDLRFLFRAYRYAGKKEDWTPLPSVEGRADAPDSATNINGGN